MYLIKTDSENYFYPVPVDYLVEVARTQYNGRPRLSLAYMKNSVSVEFKTTELRDAEYNRLKKFIAGENENQI